MKKVVCIIVSVLAVSAFKVTADVYSDIEKFIADSWDAVYGAC